MIEGDDGPTDAEIEAMDDEDLRARCRAELAALGLSERELVEGTASRRRPPRLSDAPQPDPLPLRGVSRRQAPLRAPRGGPVGQR